MLARLGTLKTLTFPSSIEKDSKNKKTKKKDNTNTNTMEPGAEETNAADSHFDRSAARADVNTATTLLNGYCKATFLQKDAPTLTPMSAELSAHLKNLAQDTGTVRIAVTGRGGVGKSALVSALCGHPPQGGATRNDGAANFPVPSGGSEGGEYLTHAPFVLRRGEAYGFDIEMLDEPGERVIYARAEKEYRKTANWSSMPSMGVQHAIQTLADAKAGEADADSEKWEGYTFGPCGDKDEFHARLMAVTRELTDTSLIHGVRRINLRGPWPSLPACVELVDCPHLLDDRKQFQLRIAAEMAAADVVVILDTRFPAPNLIRAALAGTGCDVVPVIGYTGDRKPAESVRTDATSRVSRLAPEFIVGGGRVLDNLPGYRVNAMAQRTIGGSHSWWATEEGTAAFFAEVVEAANRAFSDRVMRVVHACGTFVSKDIPKCLFNKAEEIAEEAIAAQSARICGEITNDVCAGMDKLPRELLRQLYGETPNQMGEEDERALTRVVERVLSTDLPAARRTFADGIVTDLLGARWSRFDKYTDAVLMAGDCAAVARENATISDYVARAIIRGCGKYNDADFPAFVTPTTQGIARPYGDAPTQQRIHGVRRIIRTVLMSCAIDRLATEVETDFLAYFSEFTGADTLLRSFVDKDSVAKYTALMEEFLGPSSDAGTAAASAAPPSKKRARTDDGDGDDE